MENRPVMTAEEQGGVFYKAPFALVTRDFVQIDKIYTQIKKIEGVNVRRRRGIYFGWGAFWAFVLFAYGLIKSQAVAFQQAGPWSFSFSLSSQPLDWFLVLAGLLIFFPCFHLTLLPPFGLYLEISEGGDEKEILVRTSFKAQSLEKMARAIEKAIDWDYAPIKTS